VQSFLQDFATTKDTKYSSIFEQVHGVTEAVALCDGCIEIPQLGTKH
jgi:hypothetical protein